MNNVKKPLNNSQRTMLDKIYSERLEVVGKRKESERDDERKKLTKKILQKEGNRKEISNFLKNFKSLAKDYVKVKGYLKENGLSLSNTDINPNYRNEMAEINLGLASSYGEKTHKEIVKFNEETGVKNELFSRVKTEMRAKIYGVDVSYEEIEKEIEEALNKLS